MAEDQHTQMALMQKDIGDIKLDIGSIVKTNKDILYPLRDWKIIAHYKLNSIFWVLALFVGAAVYHFSGVLLDKMYPR